jgi:phosphonate transport system substrate-binding protein
MGDASGAISPSASARSSGKIHLITRVALYVSLAVVLGLVIDRGLRERSEQATLRASNDRLAWVRGLTQPSQKHLAAEYSDKGGRLLADPPADAEKLLDPETLVLGHYVDAGEEAQLVDWPALQAQLAEATGKNVVTQEFWNSADDVAAVKAGKIQLVALHAADTPYLVNNAGFIPVAVLGTEAGANGNRLDIAVPANSKIEKLVDLRGHTLTCTAPDSMTGYRAAVVVLMQEAGLAPDRDYSIAYSHGQRRSVLGVVAGDFAAAALSDDKVKSMLKSGSIKAEDYRIIHQSQVIPRLTIGYVYNLKPELIAKVTSVMLQFQNEGGTTEETGGIPMHFFPLDYKQDFFFLRTIDDFFDPRLRKMRRGKPAPGDTLPNA